MQAVVVTDELNGSLSASLAIAISQCQFMHKVN